MEMLRYLAISEHIYLFETNKLNMISKSVGTLLWGSEPSSDNCEALEGIPYIFWSYFRYDMLNNHWRGLAAVFVCAIYNKQVSKYILHRGKSILELWVTTYFPDSQPHLIFVRFISNFLCMCSYSMASAHVILN